MKKAFILVITLALFAAGCKKNDTAASVESSWTLGSTTYKAVASNKGTTSGGTATTLLSIWDAVPVGASPTVNSINFTFQTAPTTSGSYELVGLGTALNANNFQLSAGGPGGTYAYNSVGVKAQVTVTNGKVKVVVPEVSMMSTTGQPAVKLTANVQEMN
ncbi:hypothetical protein ACFQZS_19355 [Mucilaginibacter calamicampi]|uniref:Lipocalin-like domain-containing protein n=1 Tax=Mucilaginibacter calamicampi TaxID=1302352 RepID=A0ABW2Z0Q8_9SPHI